LTHKGLLKFRIVNVCVDCYPLPKQRAGRSGDLPANAVIERCTKCKYSCKNKSLVCDKFKMNAKYKASKAYKRNMAWNWLRGRMV
jgi:hypothetical protein